MRGKPEEDNFSEPIATPDKIALTLPFLSGVEQEYIYKALLSGKLATSGDFIEHFDQKLAEVTQTKFGLAVNSGTAAIHLALLASGVKPGEVVFCQTLTYCATAYPIRYVGAEPFFIDSEFQTWNMDPDLLEEAIVNMSKKGRKMGAILYVHIYGMPAQYHRIAEIAKKYELPLIEDAAEAFGSSYMNKPAGSLGDFGVFSFNGNKIITTGGGGALFCNKIIYYERAKMLSLQGKDSKQHFNFEEIAFNYRMNNIAAALGLAQLINISERLEHYQNLFESYKISLGHHSEIAFHEAPSGHNSNRWLNAILLPDEIVKKQLIRHLYKKNIEVRELMRPLHTMPVFRDYNVLNHGVSEDLYLRGICLPGGMHIRQDEITSISTAFKEFF
ncbi:MAG: DegT/DnrJ/EryC1/StrS family aminotransferase [Cyclobacteriaceae bacterium]|nr:DegT/DnrJ/EryC1/StrS family aminotransferase [Cyclobacteriaceae bacterium]